MRAHFRVVLVSLLLAGACGGKGAPVAPECGGDGGGCTCASEGVCAFSVDTCSDGDGGPCSFTCMNRTSCGGFCTEGCAVQCTQGSICTVAVGAGSTVVCDGASTTCHVKCADSCTVTCRAAQCDLACGDQSSFNIPNGGKCP
jgi:hypothetical protein